MAAPITKSWKYPKGIIAGGSKENDEDSKVVISCPGFEPSAGGTYLEGIFHHQPEPEYHLLSQLLPQAEVTARAFSNEVLTRLANTPIILIMPVVDLGPLTYELRHWFTNLFRFQNPASQEILNPETESQQNQFHLPLSFLLNNLEIILKFGQEVTAQSSQSELSWRAFVESLSLEFARKQVDVEYA